MPRIIEATYAVRVAPPADAANRSGPVRLVIGIWNILATIVVYLGVIVATLIIELFPLNLLKWARIHPPCLVYWVLAGLLMALITGYAALLVWSFRSDWKLNRINIDTLAKIIGATL